MAIFKTTGSNISIQVRLRPTPPSQYDKYSGPLGGQVGVHLKSNIPPLSLASNHRTSVSELGLGWQDHLHPDGNHYYWNKDIKVATYSNPLQENVDTFIRVAKTRVEELARSQNADIASTETYFLVTAVCGNTAEIDYYMINHDGGVPFWVEEASIDITLSDLQPYESEDNLHLVLRPQYWSHVENFPAHRAVAEQTIDDLVNIIAHSGIDDLTSPYSISPWGGDECLRLLKFINELKNQKPSAYRTASIARLWSTISRVRCMNRHGLPGPRLDRLQGLDGFIATQLKPSILLSLVEILCFNLPKRMFYQLSELWNGRLVYIRHWDQFLDEYRAQCLLMASISGAIICLSTFTMTSKSLNNGIVAATSLSIVAMFTSIYLYERHSRKNLNTAMDISAYLSRTESFHNGLRPLSVALSLPRALALWASILFQLGLIQSVKPPDGSTAHGIDGTAWIAPPVAALLVFFAAGGGTI